MAAGIRESAVIYINLRAAMGQLNRHSRKHKTFPDEATIRKYSTDINPDRMRPFLRKSFSFHKKFIAKNKSPADSRCFPACFTMSAEHAQQIAAKQEVNSSSGP